MCMKILFEVMFLAQNFALNIPTLTDDLSSMGFPPAADRD
ncbi:hypothetical protein PSYJA_16492 [Pseudomonas syringae pv. japonica str. M301072]|uniref:Uncharacterized protein n=1 Tax=Pseudomonas syringae pv. japonica str. M301072 TaxID=629262 RepID=F3FJU7_PSESX|nr:hypothetical protein PSYJA_16492 [Pseudomonas syringae pv. japonica str. M301072]